MYRFFVAAALLFLAAFGLVIDLGAGDDLKGVSDVVIRGTGGTLAVIDGEVFMAPLRKGLGYSWRMKRTEKGYLVYQKFGWDTKAGQFVNQPAPFYLSCEPAGKGGRVFIAKEPGEGSYWGLPRVPSRKDPDYDDGGESRPGPIRCKFGSLALDTKNAVERVIDGQKLRLYPVRVVEKEGEISYRFVVSTG
jgi:hypothetical protein